jgi:SAM-dependent methyltransferase
VKETRSASQWDECLRPRANMLEKQEAWRPPLFSSSTTRWSAIQGRLRRFFDLQAGSIWKDMTRLLPQCTGVVLDAGCGAQPYRGLFDRGASYRAIDTVSAKPHFGYEIPDAIYYEGDIWPVANSSVDFILCTETLEHVFDTRQFLMEARRCLRPGGFIVLTVPFSARWHFIPYDYWRFTPSALDRLLHQCGFTTSRVYARGNAGTVACYKLMAVFLPLLMPQGSNATGRWMRRLLGILFIPLLILVAAIGNLTLLGRGGDDCLGYTVLSH